MRVKDTLLPIQNDINKGEEDIEACMLDLCDRVQALLDWCTDIVEYHYLPSPLLTTIGTDGQIHWTQTRR